MEVVVGVIVLNEGLRLTRPVLLLMAGNSNVSNTIITMLLLLDEWQKETNVRYKRIRTQAIYDYIKYENEISKHT